MQVYPAIDLQNGQCVRLFQGKFDQATLYSNDPFATTANFQQEGAEWLHLVDLDGAKDPAKNQAKLIKQLITKTLLKIQTGGGIRAEEQIKCLLNAGVERVVIGSHAVNNPSEVQQWLKIFGKARLVLAMDVQFENAEPYIVISGWREKTQCKLIDLINYYQNNLQHILCTDVSRDGTMAGINCELYIKLMHLYPKIEFQASGGIHSLQDIRWLKEKSIAGAIVGRALYERKFTLREALAC